MEENIFSINLEHYSIIEWSDHIKWCVDKFGNDVMISYPTFDTCRIYFEYESDMILYILSKSSIDVNT